MVRFIFMAICMASLLPALGQADFESRLRDSNGEVKALPNAGEVSAWLTAVLDTSASMNRSDLVACAYRYAGNWHRVHNRYVEADSLYKLGAHHALQSDHFLDLGKCLHCSGLAFRDAGQFSRADSAFRWAIWYKGKADSPKSTASSHGGIATLYERMGRYADARLHLDSSFAIRSVLGDSVGMSKLHNLRGTLAYYQDDDSTAVEQFLLGLELAKQLGDVASQSRFHNNLLNAYNSLDMHEEALQSGYRSLALKQHTSDSISLASSWQNLGSLLSKVNKPDSAKILLEKALGVFERREDPEGIASVHVQLMENAIDLNQFERGVAHGKESLDWAIKTGLPFWERAAHSGLSICYSGLGHYRLAWEHLERWTVLEQELHTDEELQALTRMEMQHTFALERAEEERRVLAERAALEAELAQEAYQRKQGVAVAIGVSLIALLLLVLVVQRNRSNRSLQQEKQKVEKGLADKELLLKEVHHRVKNNLQLVSSLLNIQARSIDDGVAKQAVQRSQQRVKSLAIIHQELYTRDEVTGIDMRTFLEKLTQGLQRSFGDDSDAVEVHVDCPNHVIDVDVAIPLGLIFNELITNAFKHAFEEGQRGKISVKFAQSDKGWTAVVKDNGSGPEALAELEASKSFGVRMIRSLAQRLEAELSFRTEGGLETTLTCSPA